MLGFPDEGDISGKCRGLNNLNRVLGPIVLYKSRKDPPPAKKKK